MPVLLTPTLSQVARRRLKRFFVALVGGTVLGMGILLIVLPGPAVIVIPAGLAILAIEFAWAKRWLERARELLKNINKSKSGESKP